jgi:hypothetical protein
MRFVYLPLLSVLFWSFWKAMVGLRRRSTELTPILGWIVGLGFFILAPLTVIALNGGYQIPSFSEVNDSYARVDLSKANHFISFLVIWSSLMLSFIVVITFVPWIGQGRREREVVFDESKFKKVILVTGGFALIEYLVSLQMAGGLADFLVSHWYARQGELIERFGEGYVLWAWLSQANHIVFTASSALYTHSAVKRQNVNWRFTLLILLLFLLQVMMLGNRIFFALYALSFGISCWTYRRKRIIAMMLLIAPALVLVFSAWAYFRHNLSTIGEDLPGYIDSDRGNPAVTSLMEAFEGADTVILFHIIGDFGNKHSYLYGATYARVFFFWIPRSIYPAKPAGFASQLAAIYEPGELTSLNATALGEMYANFGPLSLLTLPLFTLSTLLFDGWLARRRASSIMFLTTSFLIFIWLARSSFADNVITLVFAIVLIRALNLEKSRQSQGQFRLAAAGTL